MEYLSGGSLKDLIEKTYSVGRYIKTVDASTIVRQILEAVAYLHDFNVVHRDLKPGTVSVVRVENIMFAKQNDISSLNLIDFGLSASHKDSANLIFTKRCGTAIYMAPEIFNESSYTKVLHSIL
eukprot:TRINITY_DN1753_c0_g1_i15.p2 TRINITY_DN1753_c0_g1~~TRINITY_DN1753_c0_g1_i15.p2  ORF type:complete len:124 (-),score=20.08 TRINITY_DN1753_c0_g1_i15:1275-1646(-)